MNSNTKISIIIPNYNGQDIIQQCLDSILMQDHKNIEIIFIDDNSTDSSLNILEKFEKNNEIILIKNSKNHGYSGSCYLGGNISTGEICIFMNTDAFFIEKDTLTKIITCFKEDKKLGVLGFNQRNQDGSVQFTGANIDICLSIDTLNCKNESTSNFEDVMMTGGACYAIKNSVYKDVGGIDKSYFLYAEELDLMWRIQLRGYKVRTALFIPITHLGGVSTKHGNSTHSTSKNKIYYTERNSLRTILTNFSLSSLIGVLPIFFIMQLLQICFALLTGNVKFAKSYIKADIDCISGFQELLKKRKLVQSNRKVSDFFFYRRRLIRFRINKILYILKKGIPKLT
jgi:GT2 family glycosyltransferase